MENEVKAFAEALFEFINAHEQAISKLKAQIKKVFSLKGWDPAKIQWEKAAGARGEYERSEDINNPEFKAMLQDLAGHGGKLTRGEYFYWVYRNGSTVGRKKKGGSYDK